MAIQCSRDLVSSSWHVRERVRSDIRGFAVKKNRCSWWLGDNRELGNHLSLRMGKKQKHADTQERGQPDKKGKRRPVSLVRLRRARWRLHEAPGRRRGQRSTGGFLRVGSDPSCAFGRRLGRSSHNNPCGQLSREFACRQVIVYNPTSQDVVTLAI